MVVTGAANGIGLATATLLWERGWAVVLADLDVDRAEDERRRLDPAGGATVAHRTDVTDTAAVADLMAAVHERFGRLDALVNNAGRPVSARLEELTDEAWSDALDVNLGSAMRCCRAALPLLRCSSSASVVNMASAA
ncbi:MAG: SDR family oxidoreductase, partial [Pseudonocardia sp.]|nr:SDR family oxidoreductase [Pseudonocardia sp.]